MGNLVAVSEYLYVVHAGSKIESIVREAVRIASDERHQVMFDFSGIFIRVEADSDPELIIRDFNRAQFGCAEKIVGPYPNDCLCEEDIIKSILRTFE